MSENQYQRIDVITGPARRRRWTTKQKLRIIEESYLPGASMSEVARRHGVAANLLFRWRKLLTDGGTAAVGSDEEMVGASQVRKLEARIRELERQLGRKPLEVEFLKEALAARLKRCGGGKRGAELLTRGFAGYRHLSPGNGSVSPSRESLQKLTHCFGALGPGH